MKHWYRYSIVLVLTSSLFVGAWYVSTLINNKKLTAIQNAQERVATDILSSELASDHAISKDCNALEANSFQDELKRISDKIAYSEKNLSSPTELNELKKQYSLVEIRDFLLVRRVAATCKQAPDTILYFYGAKETCVDCAREGYVLDALRGKYPSVRIYSFDYAIDLSIIDAMKRVYGIGETIPALVVNGVTRSGFQTLEQLEPLIK